MARRPEKKGISYELALQEVLKDFDPLVFTPVENPERRHWVMESQAAEILGTTKRALERRRTRGSGPVHHKRYGYISYYVEDLDAWAATKPKGYRAPPE